MKFLKKGYSSVSKNRFLFSSFDEEEILMGYKSVFSQIEKKIEKIENTVGNSPKIELL
jgi:hypothetical protein